MLVKSILFSAFTALGSAAASPQPHAAWTRCSGEGPPARYGHSMVAAGRHGILLFGGHDNGGGAFSDTWLWTAGKWAPHRGDGPPGRSAHALAYDASRDRVVLFGGVRNETGDVLADTWEWDGARWRERVGAGPPPRRGHAMAWNAERKRVVLFGGIAGDNHSTLGDTWHPALTGPARACGDRIFPGDSVVLPR